MSTCRTPDPGVEALAAELAETSLPDPLERRRLRMEAGVSLRRVGRAVGVAASTVQAWEDGAQPRPDKARLYRSLLDVLAEASRAA